MKSRDKYKSGCDQTFLIRNGGIFLEERIAFCHGKSNPVRHFSQEELGRATNYYKEDQIFVRNADYRLYKGSLKDRPVLVKKYLASYDQPIKHPYKDIVIGSQMSVHKNVLKVLGCCLETEQPITVYEYAGSKLLSEYNFATNAELLPWKCRVRVARDLGHAIAYLHNAFPRPVIHRDINSSNVILDQNNVPKLMDFGSCISIPEGKSRIEDAVIVGGRSFAPENWLTGCATEKADVYSFGGLLLELLIGKSSLFKCSIMDGVMRCFEVLSNVVESRCFEEISNVIDSRITNEGIQLEQLRDFYTLLQKCTSLNEEERPTMIEVVKELRKIYQSCTLPC